MEDSKEKIILTVAEFQQAADLIETQLSKVIVGQKQLIHDLLVTLIAGGNALLEGVPGLGKTILVKTLSDIINCSFSRIQFTPDLMPADIVGTLIITDSEDGQRGFRFEKGPVFANLVLADEINRAAPRTQSALLEAMQEGNVTVGGKTYRLPRPFFVMATQNPIEMEGTYPLPEAQLDRFLYKLDIPYPSEEELVEIAKRTTGDQVPQVDRFIDAEELLAMQSLAKQVLVAEQVYQYSAKLIENTHPDQDNNIDAVKRHLRVGASPRGLQAIIWGAKVEALLSGRHAVSIEDIQSVFLPALRHRLILNFEAIADGVPPDKILKEIMDQVKIP